MPTFASSEGHALAYSASGPVQPESKVVICVPGLGDLKEECATVD